MNWQFIVCCLTLLASPLRAGDRVDLALVLAADISFSVGPYELDLQRRGYVDAFRSPKVIQAITGGRYGKIAVAYLEWGDPNAQYLILPWTIIDGPQAAIAVSDALRNAPLHRSGETSISAALNSSTALFDTAPSADRLVIDLSSDGYNNAGDLVERARDLSVWNGITINGLPIVNGEANELSAYFRDCVIGGPGSFLFPVEVPDQFAQTLVSKMTVEISGQTPKVVRVQAQHTVDCQIGERKARDEYERQLNDITNGNSERWKWRDKTE